MSQFKFLDELGIVTLAKELYKRLNLKISGIIVNDINSSSDDKHVVSAKKIYEIYQELKAASGSGGTLPPDTLAKINKLVTDVTNLTNKVDGIKSFEVVVAISRLQDISSPKSNTLYFHKDTESEDSWNVSIYEEFKGTKQWITVGGTNADLSNYWAKSDISNLKAALGLPVNLSGVWKKTETNELKTELGLPDFSTFFKKSEIDQIKNLLSLPDFTNFWKKDEIEALKTALELDKVSPITLEKVSELIKKAIDEVQGNTPENKTKLEKLEEAVKKIEEKIKALENKPGGGGSGTPVDAYTKQETDTKLETKLNKDEFNTFKGTTQTALNSKVDSNGFDLYKTYTQERIDGKLGLEQVRFRYKDKDCISRIVMEDDVPYLQIMTVGN